MKKLFLIPLCLIFIVACKKDDPDGPNINQYDKYSYSTLSTEQQKDKLAAESDAILSSLSSLPNEAGIKVLGSFFNLLGQSYLDISDVLDFDEDTYIIDVKDMNGEFTWNTATESWDKKALSGKIIFNFPVEKSATNNGKVEITGTGSGTKGNPYNNDPELRQLELPKDMKLVASLSSKEVANFEIKAKDPNYNDIAKDASAKITLGNYVISANAKQEKNSKVGSTFCFKNGNSVIIDALLSSTIDWEYIYEYKEYTGYWDDEAWEWIEEYEMVKDTTIVLDYQSAEVNIGANLAMVGYVNVKELNSQLGKIYDKYDKLPSTDANIEAYVKEEAAAYDANINMTLVSKKDKYKIATVKFGYYFNVEVDDYGKSYYYNVEPILVFNDKTEVSAETFFGKGFDKVIEAWMNFFMSFE